MAGALRRHGRASALLSAGAVCLALGAAFAEAGDRSDRLFGRPYFSTGVTRDGERHELVRGTRIRVYFWRDDESDHVTWNAGCNDFGAEVEIRPRRLITGATLSTLIGCPTPRLRQDRWVARLFRSDPVWQARGRKLRLRSHGTVIRLRRRG